MESDEKYYLETVDLLLRKNDEYRKSIQEMERRIQVLYEDRHYMEEVIRKLEEEKDYLNRQIQEERNRFEEQLQRERNEYNKRIQEERNRFNEQLQALYNSKTWQLNKLFERTIGKTILGTAVDRTLGLLLGLTSRDKLLENIKSSGKDVASFVTRTRYNIASFVNRKRYEKHLNDILKQNIYRRGIIIFPPTVDWNIPLFQRPQHMAIKLSEQGYLFFYCTSNQYDRVFGFEKIQENLYITDQFQLLKDRIRQGIIDVYSTSSGIFVDEINEMKRDNIVVYEYIDTIDETISGAHAHLLLQKHKNIKPDVVFASAKKLVEEMIAVHGRQKVFYLPNGVEYEHFKKASRDIIPDSVKPILSRNRPVVGYFGALASWIDYELLNKISKLLDIELVLIGMDYDGSINRLEMRDNVHYLGVIPYRKLPEYAVHFDVAIAPFSPGEIAATTSPIKIFEYMALGKPVVTTEMEECKNYRSILIAKNHEEFLQLIKKALTMRDDKAYLALLDKEARENTWEARAKHFDEVVQKIVEKRFPKEFCRQVAPQ